MIANGDSTNPPEMLTLVPSPAPLIRIRANGRLTATEYRQFEPAFTPR